MSRTGARPPTASARGRLAGAVLAGLLLACAWIARADAALQPNGVIALVVGSQIDTVNPDGSGRASLPGLATNEYDIDQIGYSPDGSRIAAVMHPPGEFDRLYVMSADGTGLTELTDGGGETRIGAPTWTEDGAKILFIVNPDGAGKTTIRSINPDGSGETVLADNVDNAIHLDVNLPEENPWLSVAGGKVAYSSYGGFRGGRAEVFVMNIDGTDHVQLTSNRYDDLRPSLSPDGTRVAYTAERGRYARIQVVNVDGTGRERVSPKKRKAFANPVFADATHIAADKGPDVTVINVETQRARVVTPQRKATTLTDVSPDGSKLVYQELQPVAGEDAVYRFFVVGINGADRVRLGGGFDYGAWQGL